MSSSGRCYLHLMNLISLYSGFFYFECSLWLWQMRLLGECRDSIDTVKRVGCDLTEEEHKLAGFVNPNSSESQTSGTPANISLYQEIYKIVLLFIVQCDLVYMYLQWHFYILHIIILPYSYCTLLSVFFPYQHFFLLPLSYRGN